MWLLCFLLFVFVYLVLILSTLFTHKNNKLAGCWATSAMIKLGSSHKERSHKKTLFKVGGYGAYHVKHFLSYFPIK